MGMYKNTADIELVKLCLLNDKEAQRQLYDRFSGRMMTLCLRYTSSRDDAADLLQEGYIKVFASLLQFSGHGSLEGWIRSIIIHIAIRKWHQQSNLETESIENHFELNDRSVSAIEMMSAGELLKMISMLPAGYKMIFNMNVIDGYSHAEIAAMTGIKESTSRSQLVKARLMLQKMIVADNEVAVNKTRNNENT
jgi:RNA polymerase sigma factor (sigma-70 family)